MCCMYANYTQNVSTQYIDSSYLMLKQGNTSYRHRQLYFNTFRLKILANVLQYLEIVLSLKENATYPHVRCEHSQRKIHSIAPNKKQKQKKTPKNINKNSLIGNTVEICDLAFTVDMDPVQKGAILRTRVVLVNDLDVSDELCDALMSQDIFSPLMIEYIMVSFGGMSAVYIMKNKKIAQIMYFPF